MMDMDTVHHIRYMVRDRDELMEYIRQNFNLEPSAVRQTDDPVMKEALYHIEDGSLIIQISEPLGPGWELVHHLAERGPGIFDTSISELRSFSLDELDGDEPDDFDMPIDQLFRDLRAEHDRVRSAGMVGGVHYTEYTEQVKQLKLEFRHDEAIDLLLKLVDAIEAENRASGDEYGVTPWHYEQLAIVYRKEKRYADEVAILERYAEQPKAFGTRPEKLATRLVKAKILAAK